MCDHEQIVEEDLERRLAQLEIQSPEVSILVETCEGPVEIAAVRSMWTESKAERVSQEVGYRRIGFGKIKIKIKGERESRQRGDFCYVGVLQ